MVKFKKMDIFKQAVKKQTLKFNQNFASKEDEEFTEKQIKIGKLSHKLANLACRGHHNVLLELMEELTGTKLPRFDAERFSWEEYAIFRIGTSKKIYICFDRGYGRGESGILKNIANTPNTQAREHNEVVPIEEEELNELLDSDRFDIIFSFLASTMSDYIKYV